MPCTHELVGQELLWRACTRGPSSEPTARSAMSLAWDLHLQKYDNGKEDVSSWSGQLSFQVIHPPAT